MTLYKYKGVDYKITITDEDGFNEEREKQIKRDFDYLESIGDWETIKHRIINGTTWGWLNEITNTNEEKSFW